MVRKNPPVPLSAINIIRKTWRSLPSPAFPPPTASTLRHCRLVLRTHHCDYGFHPLHTTRPWRNDYIFGKWVVCPCRNLIEKRKTVSGSPFDEAREGPRWRGKKSMIVAACMYSVDTRLVMFVIRALLSLFVSLPIHAHVWDAHGECDSGHWFLYTWMLLYLFFTEFQGHVCQILVLYWLCKLRGHAIVVISFECLSGPQLTCLSEEYVSVLIVFCASSAHD